MPYDQRHWYLSVCVHRHPTLALAVDCMATLGQLVDKVAAQWRIPNRNNEAIPDSARLYLCVPWVCHWLLLPAAVCCTQHVDVRHAVGGGGSWMVAFVYRV